MQVAWHDIATVGASAPRLALASRGVLRGVRVDQRSNVRPASVEEQRGQLLKLWRVEMLA